MSKKNIYLVDLGTGSNMNLLPLAIGMVGSYSQSLPELRDVFNIEYRFLRQDGDSLATSMDEPAVVGFCCYVWNYRGTLSAARAVKARWPNTKIVLGGYSVPKAPERIGQLFREQPAIDFLIHGEGELIFADFLRQNISDQKYDEVQGLTFRYAGVAAGYVSNTQVRRVASLDDLPSPFLNGTFDQMLKTYGSAITGALWETNRGCPYQCTFCDWGNADVSKIKKYDMDRLYEEMKWICKNDTYYMFIADANFGVFPDRDLEIAGYIADLRSLWGAPSHVGTNWAKNKGENVVAIAERLTEAGIFCNVTMAIQTTNPNTLKAIKRRNLEQGKIDKIKSMFHDSHIPTYVEVILGLPLETYDTFVAGLNTVLSNRMEDCFSLYLCQLLENTEMASPESRELYSLDTRTCRHTKNNRQYDWDDDSVEFEEFVVGSSTMPIEEWRRAFILGNFLTVLYNHRAAVFPFIYLKEEFGVLPVDLMEFIVQQLRRGPLKYRVLNKSLGHIDLQAQLMLDGVSTMSPLPGAEKLIVLPHVGSAAILASGKDGFYTELEILLQAYIDGRQLPVDIRIFSEVMIYQRLRYPGWPQQQNVEHEFSSSIPEYFNDLMQGKSAPPIKDSASQVTFRDSRVRFTDFADFAANLVRGGMTVDLLEADQSAQNIKGRPEDAIVLKQSQIGQRDLERL